MHFVQNSCFKAKHILISDNVMLQNKLFSAILKVM